MAMMPTERLVKVMCGVGDDCGNTMLYEDDAVNVYVAVRDAGYAVVPAEDIEELRAHVEWGQGSPERMFEALGRISRVLESEAWR